MARNLHSDDYAYQIKNMEAQVEAAFKLAWKLCRELTNLKKARDEYLEMEDLKRETRHHRQT